MSFCKLQKRRATRFISYILSSITHWGICDINNSNKPEIPKEVKEGQVPQA
jgi:hypothetical protein